MLIDWNHFTPCASLTGGILLGLARPVIWSTAASSESAASSRLFTPKSGDIGWRLSFVWELWPGA